MQRAKAMREMQLLKEQETEEKENEEAKELKEVKPEIKPKIIKIPIDEITLYVKNLSEKIKDSLMEKLFKV